MRALAALKAVVWLWFALAAADTTVCDKSLIAGHEEFEFNITSKKLTCRSDNKTLRAIVFNSIRYKSLICDEVNGWRAEDFDKSIQPFERKPRGDKIADASSLQNIDCVEYCVLTEPVSSPTTMNVSVTMYWPPAGHIHNPTKFIYCDWPPLRYGLFDGGRLIAHENVVACSLEEGWAAGNELISNDTATPQQFECLRVCAQGDIDIQSVVVNATTGETVFKCENDNNKYNGIRLNEGSVLSEIKCDRFNGYTADDGVKIANAFDKVKITCALDVWSIKTKLYVAIVCTIAFIFSLVVVLLIFVRIQKVRRRRREASNEEIEFLRDDEDSSPRLTPQKSTTRSDRSISWRSRMKQYEAQYPDHVMGRSSSSADETSDDYARSPRLNDGQENHHRMDLLVVNVAGTPREADVPIIDDIDSGSEGDEDDTGVAAAAAALAPNVPLSIKPFDQYDYWERPMQACKQVMMDDVNGLAPFGLLNHADIRKTPLGTAKLWATAVSALLQAENLNVAAQDIHKKLLHACSTFFPGVRQNGRRVGKYTPDMRVLAIDAFLADLVKRCGSAATIAPDAKNIDMPLNSNSKLSEYSLMSITGSEMSSRSKKERKEKTPSKVKKSTSKDKKRKQACSGKGKKSLERKSQSPVSVTGSARSENEKTQL